MGKQLTGLALFGIGYAVFYWSFNILMDAYLHQGASPMNPVPLSVCLGLKGLGQQQPDAGQPVRPYGQSLGIQ